jgi:hypothetical protein
MIPELENNAENIVLAHDQELCAFDLDLYAAVLAEEDLVALFDVNRNNRSVLTNLALADSDNTAALWTLLSGIWEDDSPAALLFRSESLYDDTVL